MTEYHSYIDPLGIEYVLHAPGVRTVFQYPDGTGMPPIRYLSQRGPLQHGETFKSFFLEPRIVQVLIRYDYCNRDDYWRGRGGLLDALRPNRRALNSLIQGRLRTVLSTGDVRDLNVLIESGPSFPSHERTQWDEFSFFDTLRFKAFDPLYYDPVQKSCSFFDIDNTQIVFPITFPITFSQTSFTSNCAANTLHNAGTWFTFPTILITGPTPSVMIDNTSINEHITLNYSLGVGETAFIDLTYGVKTITKNDGTNLLGFVTSDSSLGTFRLECNPTIVNGDNVISVTASNHATVLIQWYDRYVGLGV